MKNIRIVRGKEFSVLVSKKIDRNDVFIAEYQKAVHILEEILYAYQKRKEKRNYFLSDNHTEYNNNIIAFCGERGDGKSSAMLTFMNAVEYQYNYKNKTKEEYDIVSEDSIIRKTCFVDKIHVDPSALDNMHSILDIVVSNMFRHFKLEYEKKGRKNEYEELVKSFQKVYRALSVKKDSKSILEEEYDDGGSVGKLSKLSESMRLKEYISGLMNNYFNYMVETEQNCACVNRAIIVAVDDLDMSMAAGYKIAEDIRKYLVIPGVVIIMALRPRQLNLCIEENYIRQLETNFKYKFSNYLRQEVEEMSERYISKLLPVSHRIYLPKIQDISDVSIQYEEENSSYDDKKVVTLSKESITEFVIEKIYQKTGMIFRVNSRGHSIILPNNMREMIGLIVFLNDLDEPEGDEDRKKSLRYKNILTLFNNYYRTWIKNLPARDEKEIFIRQEIEKLTDFTADMNIHTGIVSVLDGVHDMYGEKRGPATMKVSDQFRHYTDKGMNSMCCAMNILHYFEDNYYRQEVKTIIAAISFMYTVKLNMILNAGGKENGRLIREFIQDNVIGYAINSKIPGTIYQNQYIPRGRFFINTAVLFNHIAKRVGVEEKYFLKNEYNIYTSKANVPERQNIEERKKYIFAWIIFSVLSNGYVPTPNQGAVPQILLSGKIIYDNYQISTFYQVSIENYLVKMCIIGELYDYINLGIVGIEKKEYAEIVSELKILNETNMHLSRCFVTNVDIIQEMLRGGMISYNGADDEETRSEKIIEKFLNEIENKICVSNGGKQNKESNLVLLKFDDITLNIAELYSSLFHKAYEYNIQTSNENDNTLQNKVQEVRDILELREGDKILQTAFDEFSNFVTTKAKVARLEKNLMNMARDIGKYMMLTGNREYLTTEWKENICKIYGEVINRLQANKDSVVDEYLRRAYRELTRQFRPKDLREAINALQNKETI